MRVPLGAREVPQSRVTVAFARFPKNFSEILPEIS
jgi:hypothetical protein